MVIAAVCTADSVNEPANRTRQPTHETLAGLDNF